MESSLLTLKCREDTNLTVGYFHKINNANIKLGEGGVGKKNLEKVDDFW